MTHEAIGDPPAPPGRPRARVVATPAGTIWRRDHRRSPAGSRWAGMPFRRIRPEPTVAADRQL